jgi:hypothetical protein
MSVSASRVHATAEAASGVLGPKVPTLAVEPLMYGPFTDTAAWRPRLDLTVPRARSWIADLRGCAAAREHTLSGLDAQLYGPAMLGQTQSLLQQGLAETTDNETIADAEPVWESLS